MEYDNYLGNPSTGVPELEADLAFASSMYVATTGHAVVSLFAGAWEKYYPEVTQGFADISAMDVAPGNRVAVQTPYVSNSGVTRQVRHDK